MIEHGTVLAELSAALTAGEIEVIDLSHPLSEKTPMIELPPPLANAPGFTLEEICRYDERGPMFHWNRFEGSEHMGTHFDAPIHWISGRDGKDTASIPGAELIGPVVVLDRTDEVESDPDYLLEVADVNELERRLGPLPEGGWLLMRTGWAERHDDHERFILQDADGAHWPGMTAECARRLADSPLRGYGSEQVGTDAGLAYTFDPPYPAHHVLLGAGKYGLASLANLAGLPEQGAVLVAAPLRIVGGTGSPARVYALVPKA
jgi:kynurenine formamidase